MTVLEHFMEIVENGELRSVLCEVHDFWRLGYQDLEQSDRIES